MPNRVGTSKLSKLARIGDRGRLKFVESSVVNFKIPHSISSEI
jgi:hypothetical protein